MANDFVAGLAQATGLEADEARSLAGGLLSLVEQNVWDKVSPQDAAKLRAAIPEIAKWQGSAPTFAPGMLTAAALAAAEAAGEAGGVLHRYSVDPGKLPAVVPLLLAFLKSRLGAPELTTVLSTSPWLGGGR